MHKTRTYLAALAVVLCLGGFAEAQFVRLVTDFEDPAWQPFVTQPMFHTPTTSTTTRGVITGDSNYADASYVTVSSMDPWSVPSSGTHSSSIVYYWEDPADHTSMVRLSTHEKEILGNPAVHLEGKVKINIAARAFTDNTFATEVTGMGANLKLGLGIRETGQGAPLGTDGGGTGDVEYVGLDEMLREVLPGENGVCDSAVDPESDDVEHYPQGSTPPTVYDACITAGTNGLLDSVRVDDDEYYVTPWGMYDIPIDAVSRQYVFDLDALNQAGSVYQLLGDNYLYAEPNNRGTMDALIITNDGASNGPLNAQAILLYIDDVIFEAPVIDPPVIVTTPEPPLPLDTEVEVSNVDTTASLVEIIMLGNFGDPDVVLGSVENPGTSTVMVPTMPLPFGVGIVAKQTVGADISDNSSIVRINPLGNGPLRIAMGIRETDAYDNGLPCGADGTGFDPDQPSKLEFIGCTSQDGFGVPNAPTFNPQLGWFELTFNPCTDGVGPFSGNGIIDINTTGAVATMGVWEGLYFRIDDLYPSTGPFTLYFDDMKVINGNGNGIDCMIDDFEGHTIAEFICSSNETCNTTVAAGSDDIQVISSGGTTFAGQIVISAGPDGILQTEPAEGDYHSWNHARFNVPGAAGTSSGLADEPDLCMITDEVAYSGSQCLKVEFAFANSASDRNHLRLTTNGSIATTPPETFINPDSVIPFSLDGTSCDGDGDIVYSVMVLFEAPPVLGDCNGDGDIDLQDFGCFQTCYGESPVSEDCATFDYDDDNVITLDDYTIFQMSFSGVK